MIAGTVSGVFVAAVTVDEFVFVEAYYNIWIPVRALLPTADPPMWELSWFAVCSERRMMVSVAATQRC